MADHAFGTTIELGGNPIAELDNIGGIEIRTEIADASSHQSADAFREKVAGMLDAGSVPISGKFQPTDINGQLALAALQLTRATGNFVITLPAAFATTWTFTAIVEACKIADNPIDGVVPFTASLAISGKPVLAVTASTGLTAPFFTVTDDIGAAAVTPAAAGNIYEYVITCNAGCATYHITPTAAAGTITVTDEDGNSQVVITGNDSTEITAPTDEMVHAYISVQEAGKMAKVYTLYVYEEA